MQDLEASLAVVTAERDNAWLEVERLVGEVRALSQRARLQLPQPRQVKLDGLIPYHTYFTPTLFD